MQLHCLCSLQYVIVETPANLLPGTTLESCRAAELHVCSDYVGTCLHRLQRKSGVLYQPPSNKAVGGAAPPPPPHCLP